MFRLILICCLLGGALSQEYGLPATGVSSAVYNQPQNEVQVQNQAQTGGQLLNQDDQASNVLQSPPVGSEQPYPVPEEIQQELPYQGPSEVQQEQVPQELPQPEQDVVQQAEAPQQPAETYGLPPASGQGSDLSLDHPLDEEPQLVIQITESPSPPAQPSEVYGLPPDGQSVPGPRQNYRTGASYQKYQLNPSIQSQPVYRPGTQYQNNVNKYKSGNQYQKYPTQYQKYPNQYRKNDQSQQGSPYRGQYQQTINQNRPIGQYRNQDRQDITYPNQFQRYNQDQQSCQYQKNQQQQQGYRESNVYSQPRNSYQNQNYNQYPQYTGQYRQGSQYQNPTQYQQADQRRQYSPNRYAQPSAYRQLYPGTQSGHHISSEFETSNYISHRQPHINDYSSSTPGTSVSTHLPRGYQDVQTPQAPVRYILLFQRNQAEGKPEMSSVSYLSHPIPQRQRSGIQEVNSLPILVESDEVPIVLPVPQNFYQGSTYGSASSTFVSKDSPGYDQQQQEQQQQDQQQQEQQQDQQQQQHYYQQQRRQNHQQPRLGSFRNDGEQPVADIRSQLSNSQLTSYGQPSM